MPMPTKVTTISFTTAATLAAGQKFITAVAQSNVQPSYNQGGYYMVAWQLIATAAGGGTALPTFSWYDPTMGSATTATAEINPIASAGATDFASVGLPCSAIMANKRGVFFMNCGSGASGVSAYLGYGISGAPNAVRADFNLFHLDGFGV